MLPSLGQLTLSALVGALAVWLSAKLPRDDPHPPGLLRPSTRRLAARDLPAPEARLVRVADAYAKLAQPELTPPLPGEPPTPDHVVALAIGRILGSWGLETLEQANDDQITDLAAFVGLVTADGDVASRLAMHFRMPAQILEIRDQIAWITDRRARFERQRDAYQAARGLWMMRRGKGAAGLLPLLRSMAAPDPDLWHHVITTCDLRDDHQRNAALWCLAQPDCAKATAATWLIRLVYEGSLARAAQRQDADTARALAPVLARWNGCGFADGELGLTPPDALARAATPLCTETEALSNATGISLPVPRHLFDTLTGRAPHRRDNWCLVTGTLIAPPRIEDYLDDSKDSSAA